METGSSILVVVVLALVVVIVRLLLEREESRFAAEDAGRQFRADAEPATSGGLPSVRQEQLWTLASEELLAALHAGFQRAVLHGAGTLADIRAREEQADISGEDEPVTLARRYLAIRFRRMLAARVEDREVGSLGPLPSWSREIDRTVLARMFSEAENRVLDDLGHLIAGEISAQDKLDLPVDVPWQTWGDEILDRAGRPRSTEDFLKILGRIRTDRDGRAEP